MESAWEQGTKLHKVLKSNSQLTSRYINSYYLADIQSYNCMIFQVTVQVKFQRIPKFLKMKVRAQSVIILCAHVLILTLYSLYCTQCL